MIRKLFVALTLTVLLLSAAVVDNCTLAQTGPGGTEIDIVGSYSYDAGIPGGRETGTVQIQRRGDTYVLDFLRDDRGSFTAVGIRTGNTLSVCYSYPGAGERGVGVFTIANGPRLTGQWAIFGGDGKLYDDIWTAKK